VSIFAFLVAELIEIKQDEEHEIATTSAAEMRECLPRLATGFDQTGFTERDLYYSMKTKSLRTIDISTKTIFCAVYSVNKCAVLYFLFI